MLDIGHEWILPLLGLSNLGSSIFSLGNRIFFSLEKRLFGYGIQTF